MKGVKPKRHTARTGERLRSLMSDNMTQLRYFDTTGFQMRTPITVMRTYLDLVQAEVYGKLDPLLLEKMGAMEASLDGLTYFIDQMQDMTLLAQGRSAPSRDSTDIYETVAKIVAELGPLAGSKGVTLVMEEGRPEMKVRSDPFLTERAILHLLRFFVISLHRGEEARLRFENGREGLELVITGRGFPAMDPEIESMLKGLTDADANFTSLDWEKLSLPISKALMEAQGGDIRTGSSDIEGHFYIMDFRNA